MQATQQNPVSTFFHSKLRCQTFISITRNILAAKKSSIQERRSKFWRKCADLILQTSMLLLLWSRLEFGSRSTLSIHQELDQVKETFVSDIRGVVPGGAMGAMAPPDFGRSVNPTSTRGTDYARLITTDM